MILLKGTDLVRNIRGVDVIFISNRIDQIAMKRLGEERVVASTLTVCIRMTYAQGPTRELMIWLKYGGGDQATTISVPLLTIWIRKSRRLQLKRRKTLSGISRNGE